MGGLEFLYIDSGRLVKVKLTSVCACSMSMSPVMIRMIQSLSSSLVTTTSDQLCS